ncbi:hypothetical protein BKA57DRAFT_102626 [Linnemannia elongata]|nr:hypothetical protein BKA57DRAFT_102626 [Linnemannia elongata]
MFHSLFLLLIQSFTLPHQHTHTLSFTNHHKMSSSSPPPPTLCTLPVDVLIEIALALPSREFGRLLQTNRYIHQTLDTHWVWHRWFVIRLGQGLLAAKLKQFQEDASASSLNVAPTPKAVEGQIPDEVPKSNLSMTSSATKQQLIDWYRHYVRTTIPARDMVIIHMNNRHWVMEEDTSVRSFMASNPDGTMSSGI